MVDNVHYLHPRPSPVEHFVRVGSSNFRQLQHLAAVQQLPVSRFIFNASNVCDQIDLLNDLKSSGAEVGLDLCAAELSAPERCSGKNAKLPWSGDGRVLSPGDFSEGSAIFDKMASFIVQHGFHRVQAPSHYIEDSSNPWLSADIKSASLLRKSLERLSAKEVRVDFPIIVSKALLDDEVQRKILISQLRSAEVSAFWLRVANFGSDSTGVAVRKYILACAELHSLGSPLVADKAGGLSGLALAAFGSTCGICHGVASSERFSVSGWFKASGKGGSSRPIFIRGLDRLVDNATARAIMDAPHARRLLACRNVDCCPKGHDDTIKDPVRHFLHQRSEQVALLSAAPVQNRAKVFLDRELALQDRVARQAKSLKVERNLMETLEKAGLRLDRMRAVLEKLYDARLELSRSKTIDPWPNETTAKSQDKKKP